MGRHTAVVVTVALGSALAGVIVVVIYIVKILKNEKKCGVINQGWGDQAITRVSCCSNMSTVSVGAGSEHPDN